MGSGASTITNEKLKEMIGAEIVKIRDELLETIKIATNDQIIDVLQPAHVEVKIRGDGKVVWVNVDGVCKFRAKVKELELIDERKGVDHATKTKG